jgi:hypothetical protein
MNTQNRVSISAKASFDRTSNTSRHLGVLQRPPELKERSAVHRTTIPADLKSSSQEDRSTAAA